MSNFLSKIWTFLKERWALIIGIMITWGVPIYLLNEQIALTEEVSAGVKLTFAGILVLGFLFLAFRKRVYAKIITMQHGIWRGLLLLLHRGIAYGLVFGVLWGITNFAGKLYDWWKISGIVIAIGAIFYIIDEILFNVRANAVENNEEGGLTDENENNTV